MTAATSEYLIERVGERVDLCRNIGGAWITIGRDIDRELAAEHGLNLNSPAVQRVFNGGKTDLEMDRQAQEWDAAQPDQRKPE